MANRRKKNSRRRNNKRNASYDSLEPRRLLAVTGFHTGVGGVLTLEQTADDGLVTVTYSAVDDWSISDSNNFSGFSGFGFSSVIINMLDGTTSGLDLTINEFHTGDITVNGNNGARSINLNGTSNSNDGDLTINAGTGGQSIFLASTADLNVTGNLNVDLGADFDTVGQSLKVDVDMGMSFTGVNSYSSSTGLDVGGNVLVDVSADTTSTNLNIRSMGLNPSPSGDPFEDFV